ncbi:hypothetical protein OEA41_002096 [Lepraria neglecta]|uniref:Uncharacterized protein n=1 Tax=Lepraria neglecta TaxID=209136 RepID=A0AAD9ZAZ9_9LECA|nr:hypothetical protein OEA41_002096 [Lepraria neglecta]
MAEANCSTSGPMLNDIVEYRVFDVKYMADLFDNYNQKLGNVVVLLPEIMQLKVNIMAPEDIKHTWEYKILEGFRRRANEVQDPNYERGWHTIIVCTYEVMPTPAFLQEFFVIRT